MIIYVKSYETEERSGFMFTKQFIVHINIQTHKQMSFIMEYPPIEHRPQSHRDLEGYMILIQPALLRITSSLPNNH